MTLSLSHSQHVQTQKGLATQGRGLDKRRPSMFRRRRVVSAPCGNIFEVPTKYILRKSVQCAESARIQHKSKFWTDLHLLLRAGDACGEEPNAGLRRRRTHHEAGSKWQQATSAPEVQDFRHLCISFQSENLTRKCFN